MNLTEQVLHVLDGALRLQGRAAGFTRETALLGALPELDSMAVLALLTGLENHFGITFSDDVIITQGTIKIKADKVVVIRSGDKGAEVMTAYGNPATFFQVLDNGKPVNAHGNSIRYELKNRLVTITGNGQLKQEDSQVTGDLIRYDIVKQKMIAESKGPTQRVKTVFLPDQVENFDKPADQKK